MEWKTINHKLPKRRVRRRHLQPPHLRPRLLDPSHRSSKPVSLVRTVHRGPLERTVERIAAVIVARAARVAMIVVQIGVLTEGRIGDTAAGDLKAGQVAAADPLKGSPKSSSKS